ncbi:hypothetical protein N782_01760 [Pontibacillus yanchengensis Y32]|uniref:Uncharacterized protein n=1 Tax=Pontibacillus yanchengensis Y32 TaxID=1385514 RepID=A0A0A2TAE4_9BACI|nr:hypothetical protein N782_01760 [Pontibacillus yanchengensis Y32]
MKKLVLFTLYGTSATYSIQSIYFLSEARYSKSFLLLILLLSVALFIFTYLFQKKSTMYLPIILLLGLEIIYLVIYPILHPSFAVIFFCGLLVLINLLVCMYLSKHFKQQL